MEYTNNLQLKKPRLSDTSDLVELDYNWDTLDKHVNDIKIQVKNVENYNVKNDLKLNQVDSKLEQANLKIEGLENVIKNLKNELEDKINAIDNNNSGVSSSIIQDLQFQINQLKLIIDNLNDIPIVESLNLAILNPIDSSITIEEPIGDLILQAATTEMVLFTVMVNNTVIRTVDNVNVIDEIITTEELENNMNVGNNIIKVIAYSSVYDIREEVIVNVEVIEEIIPEEPIILDADATITNFDINDDSESIYFAIDNTAFENKEYEPMIPFEIELPPKTTLEFYFEGVMKFVTISNVNWTIQTSQENIILGTFSNDSDVIKQITFNLSYTDIYNDIYKPFYEWAKNNPNEFKAKLLSVSNYLCEKNIDDIRTFIEYNAPNIKYKLTSMNNNNYDNGNIYINCKPKLFNDSDFSGEFVHTLDLGKKYGQNDFPLDIGLSIPTVDNYNNFLDEIPGNHLASLIINDTKYDLNHFINNDLIDSDNFSYHPLQFQIEENMLNIGKNELKVEIYLTNEEVKTISNSQMGFSYYAIAYTDTPNHKGHFIKYTYDIGKLDIVEATNLYDSIVLKNPLLSSNSKSFSDINNRINSIETAIEMNLNIPITASQSSSYNFYYVDNSAKNLTIRYDVVSGTKQKDDRYESELFLTADETLICGNNSKRYTYIEHIINGSKSLEINYYSGYIPGPVYLLKNTNTIFNFNNQDKDIIKEIKSDSDYNLYLLLHHTADANGTVTGDFSAEFDMTKEEFVILVLHFDYNSKTFNLLASRSFSGTELPKDGKVTFDAYYNIALVKEDEQEVEYMEFINLVYDLENGVISNNDFVTYDTANKIATETGLNATKFKLLINNYKNFYNTKGGIIAIYNYQNGNENINYLVKILSTGEIEEVHAHNNLIDNYNNEKIVSFKIISDYILIMLTKIIKENPNFASGYEEEYFFYQLNEDNNHTFCPLKGYKTNIILEHIGTDIKVSDGLNRNEVKYGNYNWDGPGSSYDEYYYCLFYFNNNKLEEKAYRINVVYANDNDILKTY